MAIGAGLLSTFEPGTGHSKWIGYQVIFGMGVGLGMQQPMIAVQTVLELKDVPTGTAVVVFVQSLGGALFVSVSQSVFQNKLVSSLKELVPQVDPNVVLATGATSIQKTFSKYIVGVTQSYSEALTNAFYVAVAMAAISTIGAVFMEWKSVKGKKIEMAAA